MADDGEDEASKTEEATPKKLEDARKKGQAAQSREINHFFIIMAFTFLVMTLLPSIGQEMLEQFSPFITAPENVEMTGQALGALLMKITFGLVLILLFPMSIAFFAAIFPAIVQNKVVFTAEQIKPKLSKISPLEGMKRLFGKKAWVEFVKNFLKIAIVGAIGYLVSAPFHDTFPSYMNMPMHGVLAEGQSIAGRMLIGICAFLLALASADYLIARQMHLKEMRMSKKEVKDEHKQQEGDPHVKAKQRQIQRERSRKRMMANVPEADVVITNPTHYACALEYKQEDMSAPRLVAKGMDDLALRIRALGEENEVPIVENPPLARALYASVEIDEEIPPEHYAAVAEVIGYVMRLKGQLN